MASEKVGHDSLSAQLFTQKIYRQYSHRILDILSPLHEAAGDLASFTSQEPGVSDWVIVLREWLEDGICNLAVKNPSAMLKPRLMASALDIEHRPDGQKGSILHRVHALWRAIELTSMENSSPYF